MPALYVHGRCSNLYKPYICYQRAPLAITGFFINKSIRLYRNVTVKAVNEHDRKPDIAGEHQQSKVI